MEAAAPMMMGRHADDGWRRCRCCRRRPHTPSDVILKDHGSQKIAVIKKVKEIAGLGLKEAKEVVDGCPSTIKEALPEDEAKKLKEELEGAGATVELKGVA